MYIAISPTAAEDSFSDASTPERTSDAAALAASAAACVIGALSSHIPAENAEWICSNIEAEARSYPGSITSEKWVPTAVLTAGAMAAGSSAMLAAAAAAAVLAFAAEEISRSADF